MRGPIYSGDPVELISKFAGQCIEVQSTSDKLKFCFEGESQFNGKSLGFFDGYHYSKTLKSFTKGGYLCQSADEDNPHSKEKFYSMEATYECDNTVSKKVPSIPTFWVQDNCTINVLVKLRQLCKHHSFSDQKVIDVVCIDKEQYEGNIFF